MLAIAVLRCRVAPVLDWCSNFVIYPDVGRENEGREITLDNSRRYETLKRLCDLGVGTLICGALTNELLDYAQHLNIEVIYGVAGAIPEIMNAYSKEELHHPQYRLPGCKGPCHYRQRRGLFQAAKGGEKEELIMGQGVQGKQRRGRAGQRGRGASSPAKGRLKEGQPFDGEGLQASLCICLQCGKEVSHQQGIPCFQMTCPQCGQSMRRK